MAVQLLDTFQIAMNGLCFGQRIRLRHTYAVIAVSPSQDEILAMNEIITQVQTPGPNDLKTSYLSLLPIDYVMDEIRGQWLWPFKRAYISIVPNTPNGTNLNTATVSSDSAAVTRRTNIAGRDQISTLKIGPAPDGASSAGLLVSAYRILLNSFATESLKALVMPVSGIIAIPTILLNSGQSNNRDLRTAVIGLESRVMRRRVVRRGE